MVEGWVLMRNDELRWYRGPCGQYDMTGVFRLLSNIGGGTVLYPGVLLGKIH